MKLFERNIRAALVAAALALTAGTLGSVMGGTDSYAQQGRACPEGFEINRGQCEMEPEITTILVCPDNLAESPLGNCIIGVGSPISSVCPASHPYQFPSTQEHQLDVCSDKSDGTGERVEKQLICAFDYELDTTIENVPRCFQVIPKVEAQVQEPCPDGSTLDTARNLCVTKPGNRNNNNYA